MMKCYRCGGQLPDETQYCSHCGAIQPEQAAFSRFCTHCGQPYTSGSRFCAHCGQKLKSEGNAPSGKRKKNSLPWIAAFFALILITVGLLLWQRASELARTRREIAAAEILVSGALIPYADENGSIPENNHAHAAEAVYARAVKAVAGGAYAFAERSGNSVILGLNSGGSYVYLPPEPAGGSEPSSVNTPSVWTFPKAEGAGGRIVTLQPSCSESQSSHPRIWDYPDRAAQGIVDALPAYRFLDTGSATDDNRDNGEVTLDFLKRLSDYSVVIWHGHGGISSSSGSFLATAIPYTDSCWQDFISGRILVCSSGVGVTADFFSKYLDENPHAETLIYLGACCSGKGDKLARAFLEKGFDCVMANADIISRTYNLKMERAFFAAMSAEDGYFATSGEALAFANSRCGDADPYYPVRARVLLYGRRDVCFARSAAPTAASSVPSETPAHTPASTEAPVSAPKVAINEKNLSALACICSVLPRFSDAEALTKQQRISILHTGFWLDGFSMFGSKYRDAAYMGDNARLPAAEADAYVQDVLGVRIPDASEDCWNDDWEVYCSGGEYEVFGSDYNVYPLLIATEQLGDGRLQASFRLLAFDEDAAHADRSAPDLVMTVRESDGYFGYTVVSVDLNKRA